MLMKKLWIICFMTLVGLHLAAQDIVYSTLIFYVISGLFLFLCAKHIYTDENENIDDLSNLLISGLVPMG